jgi:hypothetical protein
MSGMNEILNFLLEHQVLQAIAWFALGMGVWFNARMWYICFIITMCLMGPIILAMHCLVFLPTWVIARSRGNRINFRMTHTRPTVSE